MGYAGKSPFVVNGIPVIPDLTAFLGDAVYGKMLICRHVAAFDMSFLCHTFNGMGIDANLRFTDTRDITLSIPNLTSHSLVAVAKYYGITNEVAHRAKADAIASGKTLCKYLESCSPGVFRNKASCGGRLIHLLQKLKTMDCLRLHR